MRDADLFDGLAEFERDFFRDLIRSYARLDLGMRGFFYHRIKQVVREAIDLLRAERTPPLERGAGKPS